MSSSLVKPGHGVEFRGFRSRFGFDLLLLRRPSCLPYRLLIRLAPSADKSTYVLTFWIRTDTCPQAPNLRDFFQVFDTGLEAG